MTSILVNAISVREGGPLVVLRNLVAEMAAQQPLWQWHIATNERARAHVQALPRATCHVYPDAAIAGGRVRLWYETQLPRLARLTNADLLFSQTNYLPARALPCPALLLVQHAGHFSERFGQLTQAELGSLPARLGWRMKGRWVRASIRRAQAVTVQTDALAQQILAQTGIPATRLQVIAHGPGQASAQASPAAAPQVGRPIRIGYVTKYGVQKNFAVLFRAAAELKAAGLAPTVVLTLAEGQRETREVLALASQSGIGDCVENHGELGGGELGALYRSLHLFVFPSWCESFGFPLVEAMAHGLPLLVADTPSNTEIAGAAGLPFGADDAPALAALVRRLAGGAAWHGSRARASCERATQFSWHKAAAQTLALIDRTLTPGAGR